MKAQWIALLLAAGALTVPASAAATPEHERAIQSARDSLEAFDLDRARSWLEVALATSETPEERAVAWDLKGALEGIENRFGTAFEAFFAAARLGGKDAVTGIESDKLETRRVARCAVSLVEAGLSLPEAEARLRSENRVETWGSLDDALQTLLFEGRFACPTVSRPPVAEAEPAPPPPLPEPRVDAPPPPDGSDGELRQPQEGGGIDPPAASWILGGVAVAAAGTGGVLAGLAFDEAGTVGGSNVGDEIASVDDKLTAANVAYATAGVAAVGAVLFWLLDGGDDSPTAEVDVAPGAFSVRF
ncbi:MAG: hypothetical protein AAFZ18_14795 [Myxococcota bacterium]